MKLQALLLLGCLPLGAVACGAMIGNDYVVSEAVCSLDEDCPSHETCDLATKRCQPPKGWTCDARYYDEGKQGPSRLACDCGCGLPDPDCADGSLAACDYCDDAGSCSFRPCSNDPSIAPKNNATCE
ncbi:MAG: hypothetical protein FJ096_16070 [Deltaproteobacteria bacterium]|nr:hypothetical protein [Deltaproteobacteria bacterium]